MGIGKINSIAAASLAKVNSIAKASINKINSATASFTAAFTDSISFDFDGTNDYLTGSHAALGELETTGSVSVWVKIDSMSANGFIWQISAESGEDDQVFILWHNTAAVIRANVKLDGVSNKVDSGSGLENDGEWHHVVVTWLSGSRTAALNIVRMYIDGSETDTDAIDDEWGDASPPANFTVGRNNPTTNHYFNGHINDLAVFDDVLTAGEVSAIYNSGSPKDESSHSGLQSYYTMEAYSNGDSTVADDSSNSNSLTINNNTDIDSSDTP